MVGPKYRWQLPQDGVESLSPIPDNDFHCRLQTLSIYLKLFLQGVYPLCDAGRLVASNSSSCLYNGTQICSGAVTNRIGRWMAKVCDNGVLRYMSIDNLSEDYPLVGRNAGMGKGTQTKHHETEFKVLKIVVGKIEL